MDKAIAKLLKILDKHVLSLITGPIKIKSEGIARTDVKALETLRLAQAKVTAQEILSGKARLLDNNQVIYLEQIQTDTILLESAPDRIEPTINFTDIATSASSAIIAEKILKDINTGQIIFRAAAELDGKDAMNETPVSDDWLARWRQYAECVSEESIQLLWAKILAGEIISPGTFSPRTLHLLHNFSQQEAEQVAWLSQYAIGNSIYKTEITDAVLPLEMLLHFEDVGLISSVMDEIKQQINSIDKDRHYSNLRHGNEIIVITHPNPNVQLQLPCYRITRMGQELMRLCDAEPAPDNLKMIGLKIKAKGFEVSIGKWRPSADSKITILDLKPM